ncbi:MAG TPA: hypothetical protein VJ323_05875 [Bryobacteraceae bacterium]|jgi:hypothetical protein|nr:hypothetical protein [Bryobacteraceae bacterium]
MTKEARMSLASCLRGVAFIKKQSRQYTPDWDHDHCAACWTKFAEWDGPDILHDGYATTAEYDRGEDYDWVCPTCFDELRDEMGWRLVE